MTVRTRKVITLALTLGMVFAAASPAVSPAQDQATTVAPLDARASLLPIPEVGEGAPMFSAEELETVEVEARRASRDAAFNSRRCVTDHRRRLMPTGDDRFSLSTLYNEEWQAQLGLMSAADRAAAATEKAIAARRDGAKGVVTQAAADQAELQRQAAVKRFLSYRIAALEAKARIDDRMRLHRELTTAESLRGEMQRLAVEREFDGGVDAIIQGRNATKVSLLQVSVEERNDGASMMVTGRIRNAGERVIAVPPLSLTAVDQNGSALKTVVADPGGRRQIPAGGETAFAYEFQPKPRSARTVLVTIASDRREPPMLAVGMFCDLPPLMTPSE